MRTNKALDKETKERHKEETPDKVTSNTGEQRYELRTLALSTTSNSRRTRRRKNEKRRKRRMKARQKRENTESQHKRKRGK